MNLFADIFVQHVKFCFKRLQTTTYVATFPFFNVFCTVHCNILYCLTRLLILVHVKRKKKKKR